MGESSAFSYSASRYSYSYSKMLESIQDDQLFKESVTPIFGPYVNDILIHPFEDEYEQTQWHQFSATIIRKEP